MLDNTWFLGVLKNLLELNCSNILIWGSPNLEQPPYHCLSEIKWGISNESNPSINLVLMSKYSLVVSKQHKLSFATICVSELNPLGTCAYSASYSGSML